MTGVVVTVRCNWCSIEKPEFLVHRLGSGQVICDYCLDWHCTTLDWLGGGAIPRTCQICRTPWELTSPRDIAAKIYVVPKDGIYQLLCEACVRPYTAKRTDLYGNTEYSKAA